MARALYIIWLALSQFIFWLVVFPIYLVLGFVLALITAPYHLFYFSSNWSMQPKHHAPVELYLQCFVQLHPDLQEYISHAECIMNSEPAGISGWPHKTKRKSYFACFCTITETTCTFPAGANFFGMLEAAGWDRKLVWAFLRDQVEQSGMVGEEGKAAFASVMEMMNSHRVIHAVAQLFESTFFTWCGLVEKPRSSDDPVRLQRERDAEKRLSNLPAELCHARQDSLDWVLRRGVLLVPDYNTRRRLQFMTKFSPVWGKISTLQDAEKGGPQSCWQFVDEQRIYPWHGR